MSIATKITVSDYDEMMKHYLKIYLLDPNLTDRSTYLLPGAMTSECQKGDKAQRRLDYISEKLCFPMTL